MQMNCQYYSEPVQSASANHIGGRATVLQGFATKTFSAAASVRL